MDSQAHPKLEFESGEISPCLVVYSNTPPWSLSIEHPSIGKVETTGPDLFECLKKLRVELEGFRCRILCAGARIDAFASAASRDMGGARKVYIVSPGVQATLQNLVPIFSDAPPDKIASVEDQKAFGLRWLESVRKR